MTRPRRHFLAPVLAFCIPLLPLSPCPAAEKPVNELTKAEAAEGWRLLFNGRDTTGWMTNTGQNPATTVEDGCLRPHKAGGYLIYYSGARFENFVLRCEVRMAPPFCNSGIFFRISDLSDPPRHGLECQITNLNLARDDAYGAVYDLADAERRLPKESVWDWHEIELRCEGPKIEVRVDGELFSAMDCDEFTQPRLRPDGRKHKFPFAPASLPRTGWIGLQDHGTEAWFRSIRILELKGSSETDAPEGTGRE